MRKIFAVCRKELNGYLFTPGVYIFYASIFLITGWLFSHDMLPMFVQASSDPQFQAEHSIETLNLTHFVLTNALWLFCFLTILLFPFITMKSFLEERRAGSFDLLKSYAISLPQIILGKFLALTLIILGGLVCSMLFPIILAIIGDIEPRILISASIGFCLAGMTAAAFGLLASSISSNYIIAVAFPFGVLLFLFFIGWTAPVEYSFSAFLLNEVSFASHFTPFFQGVLSLKHSMYFILMTAFFLSATYYYLEKEAY